jgi:hypothetical protein
VVAWTGWRCDAVRSSQGRGRGTEMESGTAAATGMGRDRGRERRDDNAAAAAAERELDLHTDVLRGFVVAADVEHAREVERRLVGWVGYWGGEGADEWRC